MIHIPGGQLCKAIGQLWKGLGGGECFKEEREGELWIPGHTKCSTLYSTWLTFSMVATLCAASAVEICSVLPLGTWTMTLPSLVFSSEGRGGGAV